MIKMVLRLGPITVSYSNMIKMGLAKVLLLTFIILNMIKIISDESRMHSGATRQH